MCFATVLGDWNCRLLRKRKIGAAYRLTKRKLPQ